MQYFYAIFHSGSLFTCFGYGLHYNTRSKRVNQEIMLQFIIQEEDQFLCKISGSLFTSFTCFYMVVACIVMYCQDYQ